MSASLTRALLPVLLLAGACASPEADRQRGVGPGADIGNRPRGSAPIEMHAGARPYYDTPCVQAVECTGPMPVFRPAPKQN